MRLTKWHIAAGLATLHLLLAWLSYVPMPFTGGDNGTYISLARSLLDGTGYRETWDPAGGPHALYPPVFPLILAAAIELGLATEPELKWVVMVFSASAVGLAYLWARRVTAPAPALATGVVLAVAPGVLDLTHWVLSDVPFWTFAMLALWAFSHRVPAASEGGDPPSGGRHWLAIGVLAVLLAHFTRSAGLPLVAATFAFLLLRRRWMDTAVLGAVLLPAVAAWAMYGRAANASGYLDAFRFIDPYDRARGTLTFGDFARRVAANVSSYVGEKLPSTLFFEPPPMAMLVGIVIVALSLAGWAIHVRRRLTLAEVWVPLHVTLLLVWPAAWSGERFVLPVLPLMLVYSGTTLGWIGARLGQRSAVFVPAAAVMALLIASPLVMQVRYGRECSAASAQTGWLTCLLPMWQGFYAIAEAVPGRLPEDAVVLSRKPTIFFTLSGYRSSLYPLTDSQDSIFAFADSVGAEWVVADQIPDLAPRYLHPLLETYRDDFCLVSDMLTPTAILLRIDRARTKGSVQRGPHEMRECPLDQRYLSPGLELPGG